jgi:RNA polymerase sigma factor (TIGR02999 family)
MSEVTKLLACIDDGDANAAEQLLALVYDELRNLATHRMAREAPGHTLQPTALVHEAWLRLVDGKDPRFENSAHFFSAAAEAMRRILIDRARRKLTQRQGSGLERVDIDGYDLAAPDEDEQVLAMHEALDKLARRYPVQSELVKLRYFGGLTNEEAAQLLGISVATAKNYWTFARAWLFKEIKGS